MKSTHSDNQQFQALLSHHLLIPIHVVLVAEHHHTQPLNFWSGLGCDPPVSRLSWLRHWRYHGVETLLLVSTHCCVLFWGVEAGQQRQCVEDTCDAASTESYLVPAPAALSFPSLLICIAIHSGPLHQRHAVSLLTPTDLCLESPRLFFLQFCSQLQCHHTLLAV